MTMLPVDLRQALRMLWRHPGFSAAAMLTLATGIGVTAAVFAVVHAVLLRPLPYPEPERLVTVWAYNPSNTFSGSRGLGGAKMEPLTAVSPPLVQELARRLRAVRDVSGLSPSWPVTVTGNGAPEVVDAAYVTPRLLATLGLDPSIGRDFTDTEHAPGGPRVAIVSRAVWEARFGGRSLINDAAVWINGERHAIVGVLAARAALPNTPAQVLLPFALNPFASRADLPIAFVVGRLAPGASGAQAEAEIGRAGTDLADRLRPLAGQRLVLVPLHERIARDSRRVTLVLFAAVALLALIGCANVSSLVLSRNTSRRHELAVHAALGAGRWQLIRQLLWESLALSLAGSAAGILFAWVLTRYLYVWLSPSLPVGIDIGISAPVVAFSVAASLVAGVLAGIAPAWHASRGNTADALRQGSRTTPGGETRLRGTLIAAEVAIAIVLISGAALLARSLAALTRVDPGFNTEHVITGAIGLPAARYAEPARRRALFERLEARLEGIPGVTAVGFVNRLPLDRAANNIVPVEIEGQPNDTGKPTLVDRRVATPGYFRALHVPLVRGRLFRETDTSGASNVGLVNEEMARLVWRDGDPIGRRVRIVVGARTWPWVTIVGVVGNVRHEGLEAGARPEFYVPYGQSPVESMVATVRTSTAPEMLVDTVRRALWTLDAELPFANARTMEQVVAESTAQPRSRTSIIATVAVVALLLSAVGVSGAVAYAAARMKRDIALRLALGASRAHVRRLVARRVLLPVAAGAASGAALALLTTRTLDAFLFGVAPGDPVTIAASSLAVMAAAWVAAAVPALRASRADAAAVLRE